MIIAPRHNATVRVIQTSVDTIQRYTDGSVVLVAATRGAAQSSGRWDYRRKETGCHTELP